MVIKEKDFNRTCPQESGSVYINQLHLTIEEILNCKRPKKDQNIRFQNSLLSLYSDIYI